MTTEIITCTGRPITVPAETILTKIDGKNNRPLVSAMVGNTECFGWVWPEFLDIIKIDGEGRP